MNLTTHPHKSDVLTLSKEDMKRILHGEELQVSALTIKLERKADIEMTRRLSVLAEPNHKEPDGLLNVTVGYTRNVRLVFDGETKELKHVELIK